MGRRKLKMEQIPKKGARLLTFHKRKEGLKKKLDELRTLCDVDACMIIYGPDSGADSEIYPNDLFATCRLIHNYTSRKGDPSKFKTFGLKDFFQERQRKAQEELSKLTKEAKFPTWHHTFDEEKDPLVLRDFARKLSTKSQYLKSRIESMKSMKEQGSVDNNNTNQFPCLVFDDMGASCSNEYQSEGDPFMMDQFPCSAFDRMGASCSNEYQSEGDPFVMDQFPCLAFDRMGASCSNEYQSEGDPFLVDQFPCLEFDRMGASCSNEYQSEGDPFLVDQFPCLEFDRIGASCSVNNVYQSEGVFDPFVMENDRGSEEYLLPFYY